MFSILEKMGKEVLLCSHPAYNYVGRRYGWQLKSFYLDPETMPGEATFKEIKAFLEEQPAKHMLWESQPAEEIAKRFREELGLESIVFSPCEGLDPEQRRRGEDFFSMMSRNIGRLEKVFGAGPG